MNSIYLLISVALSFGLCLPFIIKNRKKINGMDFFERAKNENTVVTAKRIKLWPVKYFPSSNHIDRDDYQIIECATYEYSVGDKQYKKEVRLPNAPVELELYYRKGTPKDAYCLGEAGARKTISAGYKIMRFLPYLLILIFYGIIKFMILFVEVVNSNLLEYFR